VIPFGDDGTALRVAVCDALKRFRNLPPESAVTLDSSKVRFEEEQAEELAAMLRSCIERHQKRDPLTTRLPQQELMGPLVMCGMHRSRTSLMASMLEGAGVHLGDVLLEASEANPHGHFEDRSILDFHRKALLAQGIVSEGYTTQSCIQVSGVLRREAQSLIARRESSQCLWGWKEPRTTLFLDFWRELLPHARFLLLFRRPWEVADSLFRRGESAFEANPMLAIGVWMRYNEAVLRFSQMYPSQCLLVEASQVVDEPAAVLESVRCKFRMPLSEAPHKLDRRLVQPDRGAEHAVTLRAARPDAYELYLELRARAGSESTLPSTQVDATTPVESAEEMMAAWQASSRVRVLSSVH
jgi:hypothetical protein